MKKIGLISVIVILAFVLFGCGGSSGQGAQSGSVQEGGSSGAAAVREAAGQAASEQTAEGKQTTYPLTVTDASGKEIVFTEAPQRIVSLSPSETEVLFALGLDDRIVGVTDYCNYPEAALDKPKVGGLQGNIEAIMALEPDLVIGGLSLNKDTLQYLEKQGLRVFQVEPKSIDEAIDRILTLGVITDTLERAEQVAAQMNEERQIVLDAVQDLTPEEKKRVYLEFSPGYTVGKGVFMDELITLAGGINVAGDQEGWIQISEEKIIEADPEVIIYTEGPGNLQDIILQRSGWENITAIREGRLHSVNDDLISRPGPRLTQGLLAIAQAIYPERVERFNPAAD
jgi:iron complex transport system substrate-binding protein